MKYCLQFYIVVMFESVPAVCVMLSLKVLKLPLNIVAIENIPLKVLNTFINGKNIYFVFEYCEKGNLDSLIRKYKNLGEKLS